MSALVAIYRQDGTDGVAGATILEFAAGPKPYARVWDEYPHRVEWGWVLHPTAVKVWGHGAVDDPTVSPDAMRSTP